MVQVSASEKILVKSLSGSQVGLMDMKIGKFDEKHENSWNLILELDLISILNCAYWNAGVGNFQNAEDQENSSETQFLEPGEPQDLPGSCAARNIQDFGGATWLISMIIWLVETVSLNQACKAIFFYSGRGQIGRILGRFFW